MSEYFAQKMILLNLQCDRKIFTFDKLWCLFLFTEACIYAFCSIAEHIDSYERKSTPKLMNVLHEIPYENLSDKILGTALETIGK